MQVTNSVDKSYDSLMEELPSDRLSQVEKQLNLLCSQHDSLMPLLDITSYESILSRWDTTIKSINKKLSESEARIKQDVQGYQHVQNKLGSTQNQILKAIKTNIQHAEEVLLTGSSSKALIQSLYQSAEQLQPSSSVSSHDRLKEQADQMIEQLKVYSENCLAQFKNQLLLSEQSESNRLEKSRTLSQFSNGRNQIVQNFTSDIFNDLKKQINWLRIGLHNEQNQEKPLNEQNDFYQFSINRIGSDLIELTQMIQLLSQKYKLKMSRIKQDSFSLGLPQKLKLLRWQLKGLKKKYFIYLSKSYQNNPNPYDVNLQENKIAKDLEQLELAHTRAAAALQRLYQQN